MAELLLVVDLQNGFINDCTKHVISGIETLIEHFSEKKIPIAFTRFINSPGSPYVKWVEWSLLMAEPEINLVDNVCDISAKVFDKPGYTAFTEEFETFLHNHEIDKIILCGISTEACVLKTAVDAFERNVEPVVVQDACASTGGDEIHDAGILLISKFIGTGQMTTIQDVIQTV